MTKAKYISHEEVLQREWKDPEFRQEYRRRKPFFDVVRNLINLRHEAGITQKALAKKAGTHQSRISKIESAELDFRLGTLVKIADALDSVVEIKLVPRFSRDEFSQIVEYCEHGNTDQWIETTRPLKTEDDVKYLQTEKVLE